VAIFGLQKQQGNEDDGKVGVCVNGIAEERWFIAAQQE
jgi:hypothetical protein